MPIHWISSVFFNEREKACENFFSAGSRKVSSVLFYKQFHKPDFSHLYCHWWTCAEARDTLIFKSVLFIRKTKRPACLVTRKQWNSWVHLKFPWHLTHTEGKCLAEKQRQTLSVENPFCAHIAAGELRWVIQLFWGQWCFVNSQQSGFVGNVAWVWGPLAALYAREETWCVSLWKIWMIQMSAHTDRNICKSPSPPVPAHQRLDTVSRWGVSRTPPSFMEPDAYKIHLT